MVNTFLPYADFEKTAKTLDYKRLGKQRVEAHQIINIIQFPDRYKGWKSHPAVLMWKSYLPYLKQYYNAIVKEWIKQGYNNNMTLFPDVELKTTKSPPWWLGFRPFHLSHRASLLRKDRKHYSKYFSIPDAYLQHSYVWPTHLSKEVIKNIKDKKKIVKIQDLSVRISSK